MGSIMTDEQLAEIERVWAAATPGPWADDGVPIEVAYRGGYREDVAVASSTGAVVIEAYASSSHGVVGISLEDSAAIAAAPGHVGALLAEVRRLRSQFATAEAAGAAGKRAVRALVGMWREQADGSSHTWADQARECADELERALEPASVTRDGRA